MLRLGCPNPRRVPFGEGASRLGFDRLPSACLGKSRDVQGVERGEGGIAQNQLPAALSRARLMGAVQAFFSRNKAQSSGLSPSPTDDDTGQKTVPPTTDGANLDTKPNAQVVSDEKPPEEPESNDTSYGVEATAVRTLAASTGTVAILGTTAKVKELNDISSEELPERPKEESQCPSISITEPEPEITDETEEATEAEQIGFQEKIDHSIEEKQKEKESLKDNEQSNENHETEIKTNKTEQTEKPQNDSESIQEVVEKPIFQNQGETASKENEVKISLPQKVEDKSPDEIQKENKEHSIVPPKFEPETQKKENEQAKEGEHKLPVKEPVRIVDYQEKKDICLPKKAEEKLPELSEKNDSKLKSPDIIEQGAQDIPEKFEITQDIKDTNSDDGAKANESDGAKANESDGAKANESDGAKANESDGAKANESDGAKANESDGAKANESDGAPEESEETHDDSKTEDNEISSEQLKTNSLSDMSLSEALNSEGEEAAREAAKALELQEMVASLSATADRRALEYQLATSDAGNSKNFFLSENIVGTSTYGSEGMQTISESPIQDDIEYEPEVTMNAMHETFSPQQKKQESLKLSDNIVQPNESVSLEKELLNESEKVNQSNKEFQIQDTVKEPEAVSENKSDFKEPNEKNILKEEPEQLKELDKTLESFIVEQKPEQIQIDVTGQEKINELVEEKENTKESKEVENVEDVDKKSKTFEKDNINKSVELAKPVQAEKELEKIKSTEKEHIEEKNEELQDILNEPENKLEKESKEQKQDEVNEAAKEEFKHEIDQAHEAQRVKDEDISEQTIKEEVAVGDITMANVTKTEEKTDKKADSCEEHELSLDIKNNKSQEDSISLANLGNIETQVQDSPSDASDPPSNESNDESKLTEESRISDKEEITEVGTLQDHSKKPKDVDNLLTEVKESGKLDSVKDETLITQKSELHMKDEELDQHADNDEQTLNVAATTIQSSFRGFIARKQMKEDEKAEEVSTVTLLEKDVLPTEEKQADIHTKDKVQETINQMEIKAPETTKPEEKSDENLETISPEHVIQTNDSKVVPEPLMKIAQAEVDRICQEAEKATESLMTPPPMIDDSDIRETDLDDSEDFPAPPDDLMDSNEKNDIIKDHDSSGTQSTEPTVPLGSNTDGDSSKTEDTTAPSLAESEIKSNEPTPSQQNDDYKLESSFTENINTEVAVNRDSTEGELTMEEDSKEEDLGSILQSSKEHEFESMETEQKHSETFDGENKDKAAAIIQAGYRGFKTRKDLIKVTDSGDISKEGQKDDSTNLEEKLDVISSSTENSVSEPKNDSSSASKSEEELNESAKKIQAGIRGYLVRKDQKVKRDAAVKIQSHFRGFKTRQRLKQESS